jgi:hypothetical protein
MQSGPFPTKSSKILPKILLVLLFVQLVLHVTKNLHFFKNFMLKTYIFFKKFDSKNSIRIKNTHADHCVRKNTKNLQFEKEDHFIFVLISVM